MSGIEIAGLLLGAFPLLISALEHYRQSAKVLEDWWQIKREYQKCENEIKHQKLAFEGNLESFLLPLLVDDDEIAALIAEPGGMKWKDVALEAKLKSLLPKSYELFLATIHDIKSTVDDLGEELGVNCEAFQRGLEPKIDRPTKRSRNPLRDFLSGFKQEASTARADTDREKLLSRPNIEYQTQRVKFGLSRAKRAKLFDDFARYNARLRELLDINDRSAALTRSRQHIKNSAVNKRLWKFWRHAASLYELLSHAWCCRCKHLHHACLFLHHGTNIEHIEFKICFLYAPSLVPDLCPWSWKEMNAQHVHHDDSGEDLTLVVPYVPHPRPSVSSLTLKSSMRSPNSSPLPSRPKVNWTNAASPAAAHASHQPSRPIAITDLCSTIATCDPANNTFGLLEGEKDSYILQRGAKTHWIGEAHETVSLEDLLSKTSAVPLNRRQRYQIAFTLASSHLQLYPSPWLHSYWSKKDIVFNMDPQDPRSIRTDQPYMLRAVSAQTTTPTPTTTSTPAYASRDRSLTTLGILLIELCFGTPLEDHEMRRQYHTSTLQQTNAPPDFAATLDFAVALEWSRAVVDEAGDTYADAVNWCLKGQFAGTRDDRWRDELFANVVRPLQTCYEHLHPVCRDG